MTNDNELWFIYDYYVASGRPKAEDAVMNYAREKYLYGLAPEYMLEEIQKDLEIYCMKILAENKRLAPVSIHVEEKRLRKDGHAWLYVGAQHLCLRRVEKTIE